MLAVVLAGDCQGTLLYLLLYGICLIVLRARPSARSTRRGMLASRDRRPRVHLASARLDRASCGSAGTFASWAAHRRAGDPIDPERNHADPGSTSTSATVDRGALRLLPPRLPALSSRRLPSGTCKGNVMPLPLAALESHPPATSNLQIPAVGLRHARAAGLWKLCRSCEDRLGASFGRRRHHRTDDLRITRVFPCVARGFKARASFMFAGCCWWRPLVVDGYCQRPSFWVLPRVL